MKEEGLIEYSIPDMINHPKQAYKITEKGRKALKSIEDNTTAPRGGKER